MNPAPSPPLTVRQGLTLRCARDPARICRRSTAGSTGHQGAGSGRACIHGRLPSALADAGAAPVRSRRELDSEIFRSQKFCPKSSTCNKSTRQAAGAEEAFWATTSPRRACLWTRARYFSTARDRVGDTRTDFVTVLPGAVLDEAGQILPALRGRPRQFSDARTAGFAPSAAAQEGFDTLKPFSQRRSRRCR